MIFVVCARGNKCENAGVELEREKKLQDNGLKRGVLSGQVPEDAPEEGKRQRDQSSKPVLLCDLCITGLTAATCNGSARCRESNVEASPNVDFHSGVDVGHAQRLRLADAVSDRCWVHVGVKDGARLQPSFRSQEQELLRSMEATELAKTKHASQEIAFAEVAIEDLGGKAEAKSDSDCPAPQSITLDGDAPTEGNTSVTTVPSAGLTVVIPGSGAGTGVTPMHSANVTPTPNSKGYNVKVAHPRMGSVKSHNNVDTSKSGARR
jgi:hypothetical protein